MANCLGSGVFLQSSVLDGAFQEDAFQENAVEDAAVAHLPGPVSLLLQWALVQGGMRFL